MPDQEKRAKIVTITTRARASSDDSSTDSSLKAPSLKSPRTARFAEATAVNSPIEPSQTGRNPFVDPPQLTPMNHYMAQPQVADMGFGYINKHESVEMPDDDAPTALPAFPKSPLRSPLKSAMKTPGAPPRDLGKAIFSPTFKEEETLEKRENFTEKQQARDVVSQDHLFIFNIDF